MLGGVSADDEIVGVLDLISHDVVNLKLPVSLPELLLVVLDVLLHNVEPGEDHVRS